MNQQEGKWGMTWAWTVNRATENYPERFLALDNLDGSQIWPE